MFTNHQNTFWLPDLKLLKYFSREQERDQLYHWYQLALLTLPLHEFITKIRTSHLVFQKRSSFLKLTEALAVSYLCQPRDMKALHVVTCCLPGFARPRPFPVALCYPRPGKDIVISQIQIWGIHCKLADQLQQASKTVQLPLWSGRKRNLQFWGVCFTHNSMPATEFATENLSKVSRRKNEK